MYLLAIDHREMLHAAFKPITAGVAGRAIAATKTVFLQYFFIQFGTITVEYRGTSQCLSTIGHVVHCHIMVFVDLLSRFLHAVAFCVINECQTFDGATLLIDAADLCTEK